MCPLDVFDIEDMGGGDYKAVAARPRDCTMCRECIRTDDWSDYIELRRISDHFIFSVESVGCLAPERIVRDVSICVSTAFRCSVRYLAHLCTSLNTGHSSAEIQSCWNPEVGARK
jgi:hypothetical protein